MCICLYLSLILFAQYMFLQIRHGCCSHECDPPMCMFIHSLNHKPRCRAQDLAAGYMSGKLLLKLDATGFILAHHTADHFAFLDDPASSRARTAFYATLARLLFMEDTPAKFKSFVAPLQQVGIGYLEGLSP